MAIDEKAAASTNMCGAFTRRRVFAGSVTGIGGLAMAASNRQRCPQG
jgi:hypothetical protein